MFLTTWNDTFYFFKRSIFNSHVLSLDIFQVTHYAYLFRPSAFLRIDLNTVGDDFINQLSHGAHLLIQNTRICKNMSIKESQLSLRGKIPFKDDWKRFPRWIVIEMCFYNGFSFSLTKADYTSLGHLHILRRIHYSYTALLLLTQSLMPLCCCHKYFISCWRYNHIEVSMFKCSNHRML